MTKKLYSTTKWKKYLKARQIDELSKLQRRKSDRRGLQLPRQNAAAKHAFAPLRVPTVFSVISNPEETIGFLRDFSYAAKRYNLNLDLTGVTQITPDAIAALIAVIQALGERRIVRGSLPTDAGTCDILNQSGFFEHVKTRRSFPGPVKGRITRQASNKVEPEVARDLIRVGTEALCGEPQRRHGAYRALIESMSNTHNHAAGKHGKNGVRKTWYSTVYADVQRNRVCYTFLDTGVGIFRSVRVGPVRRAFRAVGIDNDAHILRDILQGKVPSSTGVPYRGKGLPSIYDYVQHGRINSLVIVTNGVYANVSAGEYRLLSTEFPGTLLYWET